MTLVHAIRRPRLRRAVIAGFAALATVVVAAAPAAAAAADPTRPWVAVVGAGARARGFGGVPRNDRGGVPRYDSIRVERVEAISSADAAHRVDRETGGAPILALDVDSRAAAASVGPDPLRPAQWALDELGFESVRAAVDPSTVTVAVIDTGVDAATRISPAPYSRAGTHGSGYLMVGEDGGVFDFSDLSFAGSLAGRTLARPIVAVAPGPSAR